MIVEPKSWIEGNPLQSTNFRQHGNLSFRRKVTPLNYYYQTNPIKEVPSYTTCVRASVIVEPVVYIGAQTGFAPFSGAYDKVFRKKTTSGYKLTSTQYPGPWNNDLPGPYYYKFEQEWRGVESYARDTESDSYANSVPRWKIDGGIETRYRSFGPRYARNQYGQNVFSRFGWDDWSVWSSTSEPYQADATVTVTRTTQTTDFSKTNDYGTGVTQTTSGSFTLTLSDEVDALSAAIADKEYDARDFENISSFYSGYYYSYTTASGKKMGAQSVRSLAADQMNFTSYSPHGAVGTPSVVRVFYRLSVQPLQLVSSLSPTVTWDVVIRKNSPGGDILYGNANYASTLVALERNYYDNELVEGLQRYQLDESLALEAEIIEFEDQLGKLALNDLSWNTISWLVIPNSVKDFGSYGGNYSTANSVPNFLISSYLDMFLFGSGQAWKLKIMVHGPPATYRLRYKKITISPVATGGYAANLSTDVQELVWENDFFSPELAWIQNFNDQVKIGVRSAIVHRKEIDGTWTQLKPQEFVLLYKLRTHIPWGWKPLRPVTGADELPQWQKRWKIKRYSMLYSYQRPEPVTVGSASFKVDFAVESMKLPDDTSTHRITRNENSFGGVTFPFTGLKPENFTTSSNSGNGPDYLGGSSNLFRMYGGSFFRIYFYQSPLNQIETPTLLRQYGSASETHSDYSFGSYYYKTRADPEGEIVEKYAMSTECAKIMEISPYSIAVKLSNLFELPIPDDPECSAFIENVRLVPMVDLAVT